MTAAQIAALASAAIAALFGALMMVFRERTEGLAAALEKSEARADRLATQLLEEVKAQSRLNQEAAESWRLQAAAQDGPPSKARRS